MKVYMTKKNADMIEGRGPMVNDLCFLHKKHAENYINTQPGVMGLKGKWTEDKYGGNWEVTEIEIIEHDIIEEQKNRDNKFKNLLKDINTEEKHELQKYLKRCD